MTSKLKFTHLHLKQYTVSVFSLYCMPVLYFVPSQVPVTPSKSLLHLQHQEGLLDLVFFFLVFNLFVLSEPDALRKVCQLGQCLHFLYAFL